MLTREQVEMLRRMSRQSWRSTLTGMGELANTALAWLDRAERAEKALAVLGVRNADRCACGSTILGEWHSVYEEGGRTHTRGRCSDVPTEQGAGENDAASGGATTGTEAPERRYASQSGAVHEPSPTGMASGEPQAAPPASRPVSDADLAEITWPQIAADGLRWIAGPNGVQYLVSDADLLRLAEMAAWAGVDDVHSGYDVFGNICGVSKPRDVRPMAADVLARWKKERDAQA